MELRDIEYFAVIAEHLHLGRAADALGLSHPALSKSLRRLERSVRAKLVKRNPKGVDLTAEGRALLARVRTLHILLGDVSREIAALSQGLDGHLRVGSGPGVAPELLPAACTKVLADGSKATFKITVLTNDVLVPALRSGDLDLIVSGIAPVAPADLVQEPLYDDEFVVVARAGHRLAQRAEVIISDLANERWVLSAANVVSWQALHRKFEDEHLSPPHVALESNSTSVRLQTVSRSDLLGFGSRRFMRQSARRLGLVEIRIRGWCWSRRVGVSYRAEGQLSGLAVRFVEALKSCAPRLEEK